MTRLTATCSLALILGGALFAQDGATAEDLVAKLGANEYAVRERATKDLIAMGNRAIPALRTALESEDLEIRMRAGRAMRAIQSGGAPIEKEEKAEEETPRKALPGNRFTRSVEIQIQAGKVHVKVRTMEDGKEKTDTYEGDSIEALRKKHPELRELLADVHASTGRDPFDLDRVWKEFGRDRGNRDWKKWQEDVRRQMEELRRFEREFFKEWRTPRLPREFEWFGATGGARLGVYLEGPDPVVDAQLQLRGRGLVVRRVTAGSIADKLGLRRYDILVELNGKPIVNRKANELLAEALKAYKGGTKLTAKVLRRAKPTTLETR